MSLTLFIRSQTNTALARVQRDAASLSGTATVESRAAEVTGYYIAERVLAHRGIGDGRNDIEDPARAYEILDAAYLAVRLIEGDSPKAQALGKVVQEAAILHGQAMKRRGVGA